MIPSNDTWPADVKNSEGRNGVDPNVLPEYTLLPTSPPQSVVSYDEPPPPQAHPSPIPNTVGPSASLNPNTNGNSNMNMANAEAAAAPTCGAEPLRIVKLLWVGVLALAVPPILLAWMGLATAAIVLYGCGKILEGVGRACAFVPEMVYRGCVRRRAARCWRAVSAGGGARREGAQEEQEQEECVEEGRVALEDVETGQGGPISI